MTISLLRKILLVFIYLISQANHLTLVIFILFYASCLYAGNSSYFDQWREKQLPDNYPVSCDEIFIPSSSINHFIRLRRREKIKAYFYSSKKSKKWMYSTPDSSINPFNCLRTRKEFGTYFYPSKKWMDKAAEKLKQKRWWEKKRRHGLEIMAGSGWLSYFLSKDYGFTMTATDVLKNNYISYENCPHLPDFKVHYKDACQAIKDDTEAEFLALSWPYPPDESGRDDALDAVKAWNKRGPVLYIGMTASQDTGSKELEEFFHSNYKAVHLDSDYIPAKLKGMEGLLDDEFLYTLDYPTVYIPSKTIDCNYRAPGDWRPQRVVKEEF